MIRQLEPKPYPNTDFDIQKNQTVHQILSFLDEELPQFIEKMKDHSGIKKEDDISEQLHYFFQEKAKSKNYLFNFNAKKGVDFSINITPYILGSESLFVIEAKRLPPTNHKDYVMGDTGGIIRFKLEQEGYGKHLKTAAMLGYIQKKDKSHWHVTINNWIGECIAADKAVWSETDKLSRTSSSFGDYYSSHSRLTQAPISIHHFWMELS